MIPDLFLGQRLAHLFPVEQQAQAADVERTIEDRVNYPTQRFTIACTSTTRPTNARAGDIIYETDTSLQLFYTGSYWVQLTPEGALIDTDQCTTSTTYTDLATAGPSVTVETGTKALVSLYCHARQAAVVQFNLMGFAVSGATTLAASDNLAALATTDLIDGCAATFFVTGLTPGINTFTAKFRVSGGTGCFQRRHIIVLPVIS